MKTNPILEELWKIKEDLAREAGYDVRRLCENARRWAAEHPHPRPAGNSTERGLTDASKREGVELLPLREEPPEYGQKKGEGA